MKTPLVAVLLVLGASAHAAPNLRSEAAAALARLAGPQTPVVVWPAHEATPRHVSGFRSAPHPGAAPAAARAFLEANRELIGLTDPARELRLHQVVSTSAGTAVRFAQQHQGLPVYRGEVVVMVDGQGRAFLVNSALRPAPGPVATPRVSAATAAETVAATGATPGATRLVAMPRIDELRPCWVVYGRTLRPLGVWDYLVDATTGHLVGRHNRLWHALGRVYTNSPSQGDPELIDAELTHLLSADQLEGERADVFRVSILNGVSLSTSREAAPVDGDYLYDPDELSFTDPFAEVQAYHHVTQFHEWLAETFGFQRTRRGDEQVITTFVNLCEQHGAAFAAYDNAFFADLDGDGKGDIAFGQGTVDFAYDAEVIYHEFTHSAVDEGPRLDGIDIDALGLLLDPGSLNEAFADYFPASFTDDPRLGTYVGQGLGGAIRVLVDDPDEEPATCPGSLIGETHEDSLVWSRALWDVRELLGSAVANDVIYASLQSLTASATFPTAAASLVTVVETQIGADEAASVQELLDARGLPDCSRIVPIAAGDRKEGFIFGQDTFYARFQIPHALQYAIEVPEDATRLTLSFTQEGIHGGPVELIPFVKTAEPVLVQTSGWGLDFDAEIVGEPNSDLILERDSAERPLVPGQTYYLLAANNGSDDMIFHVWVQVMTPPTAEDAGVADALPPPYRDAGLPDGAGGGQGLTEIMAPRGCACRAATSPPAPLMLVVLLVIPLLRRRRW